MGEWGRRRATATAVVIGAAVVACSGGGSTPLGRAAFTAKVNKECHALKQASDDFQAAQAPSATGKKVASLLSKAAERLRALVDDVDGLTPPAAIGHDVGTLVDVLRRYADGLETLAGKVRAGQTLQEALDANAKLVGRLNRYSGRATTIVSRLRLTGCILTA